MPMSENIRIVESPRHFIVLDAISRGVNGSGKIAKVAKIDKAEVEMILHDLSAQRLVILDQKKGLFGKKTQARITDVGSRLLASKKEELERKAREFKDMYRSGDRQGMESFMDSNRMWLPMMIFSGIMSAMMFASIMSFMGMAMNPAEQAAAGDAAGAEAQGADAQAVAEQGGADAGADSGGSDFGFDAGGGDFGGGDFSF